MSLGRHPSRTALFWSPVKTETPGWRDRFWAWRDRLLADRRFHRLAATLPITRPIANRRARELFDLCAGFVYAQTLYACIQLDVFEILAERPHTAAELAPRLGLTPAATCRLLDAACALGLTARRGQERYGLGELGAALRGNPGIAAMIRHHAMLYDDLRDPVALLRGEGAPGALARYWGYGQDSDARAFDDQQVAGYSQLMAVSLGMLADDILDAYPFGRHRSLLDVGGGEGAFVEAVAGRHPNLTLHLFDLPAVAARAELRLAAAGAGDRVRVHGGDFVCDSLPDGADVVTLVRIVHDHDDVKVLALLGNIRRALAPGGTLVIAEPMAGTAGAGGMAEAYFGFYLLAMGSGRARTPQEIRQLLQRSGFDAVREWRTRRPILTRLMTATVSGS